MDYLEIARQVIANQSDQVQPAVKPQPDGLVRGDVVTIDAQGETLYVVGDEDDVRLLIDSSARFIHRGHIWTKTEIRALISVTDDPEVLAEIRRMKRILPGRLSA